MGMLVRGFAILILGHATSVVQAATWGLAEVRVFSNLKDVRVVAEKFDGAGGFVELDVQGVLYGFCPGGSERIRLEWRFDRDVSRVSSGEKVNATLDARQVGVTRPCTDAYARRMAFSFGGSSGQLNPFAPADTALIDGGMFSPSGVARLFVKDDGRRGPVSGSIDVGREPSRDRPMAWFSVDADTSGGQYKIAYLFDTRRTAGPVAAGGAASCPPCAEAAGGMRWEAVRVGDCPGRDTGSSNSFAPDERQARRGATAVCWDGEALKNASAPYRAWCTYKSIEATACVGGANPGVLYRPVNR